MKQFQREHTSLRVIEDKTKKLSYLFNVGWKNASLDASIFAYCADDTEPDKDWLKSIVDWLQEHPDTAVSGPTLSTTQPPGEMFALYNMMKRHFFLRPFLRIYEYFVMEDKTFEPGHWPESGAFTMGAGIPLPHITKPTEIDLLTSGNMGITREAMEKVSGFDENFLFNHADGDLFIRLKRAGYKMIFHPEVKVLHHMRFGPTRFPGIMGRDTAFYYLKDVRPKSLRGWIGFFMNLGVFLTYWVFKAIQQKNWRQLKGISGFFGGVVAFFKTKTSERDEILRKLAVAGSFLFIFGLSIRKLWPPKGMPAYGDGWPFPPSVSEAWKWFRTAWDVHSPGIVMPVMPIISALLPFLIIPMALFNPINAAWFFYLILPLPICFLSGYWFIGKFVRSRFAKFVAAFIFAVNPITIGEVLGGFVSNVYAHALLPVIFFLLWQIHRGRNVLRNTLLFSAVLAFTYLNSDHVLIWVGPALIIFCILPLLSRCPRRDVACNVSTQALITAKRIGLTLLSALLVVVLTLPYTFYFFKTALPFLSGGVRPDVLKFLLGNVGDTYNRWGIKQAIRFGGNLYEPLYATDDIWARMGFIIPLLSFSWLILYAKEISRIPILMYQRIDTWIRRSGKKIESGIDSGFDSRTAVALASTVGAILIILFIANARDHLFGFLSKFSFLLRFRNTSRPSMFLAFCYLPLVALSLERFMSFRVIREIRVIRIAAWILVMLPVFYFSSPFFSGDLTMAKNRGTTYTIAPYYYEVGEWLSQKRLKTGDDFRTLWLPWNHEDAEMKLRYVDPLTYSVPINYGAYTEGDYLKNMRKTYCSLANETIDAANQLAVVGVKYIVLNRNSKDSGRARCEYGYQTPWLAGAVGDFERILGGYKDFKLVKELSKVKIYENTAYDKSKVDAALAGFAPEDIGKMQRVKDLTIAIASLGWIGSLVFLCSGDTLCRLFGRRDKIAQLQRTG